MKIENESYHPSHRNAGEMRKFRIVSQGGSNIKAKSCTRPPKKSSKSANALSARIYRRYRE
jgi:hypothetical protein